MADEDTTTKEGGAPAAKADTETKPAISFKTEGEFLATVAKKTKGAVSAAVDALRSEIAGKLGVESLDEIDAITERLKTTEKQVGEVEKLKAQHDKVTKDYAKEQKRASELSARLVKIAKRDALIPFAAQVRDPEVLAMLADPKLEVDEDGVVTVKDGTSIENLVEGLLKAKDYLRNPAHKDGAGTGSKEPLKASDGKGGDKPPVDGEKPKNGTAETPKFKSFGHAIVAGLQEKGHLPRPEGP